MPRNTRTYSFGVSKREGHDSSDFYIRNLYGSGMPSLLIDGDMHGIANGIALGDPHGDPHGGPHGDAPGDTHGNAPGDACGHTRRRSVQVRSVPEKPLEEWADHIYQHSSEDMHHIPDNSVGLAFTSPPYNAGKDFDENLDLREYFGLIGNVAREVYRVLKPGGRYVINVANLGRKPYIPMHAYFYAIHMAAGFLPAGEIIWRKGKGMSGNCAWGSWRSAKAPRLRDLHEYLLVFAKDEFGRPEKGVTNISSEEFMAATLSVWEIAPESAKKVGHPAPFPVELAARVIRLFCYKDDVVLDPFCGSGTTSVAAALNGRRHVGYDIAGEYCELARRRISEAKGIRDAYR